MARVRELGKPPIQEAVIEFHLSNAVISTSELSQVADLLMQDGWTKTAINTFQATFGPPPDGSGQPLVAQTPTVIEGYAVNGPVGEGRVVIQVREDRVTVSRTHPYGGWEQLESDAGSALSAHVKVSKADAIRRIGARYINLLALGPDEAIDFSEILTDPPGGIPGASSGAMKDFFYRKIVQGIPVHSIMADATLGVGTALMSEAGTSTKRLLIDIDVSAVCSVAPSVLAASEHLAVLRGLKNEIFFGSVEERAIEAYQ